MKKKKANNVITFRLTDDEFLPIKTAIEKTNITKTEICRSIFLSEKFTFEVKENKPIEYSKLVFIFNKTSNNINQLAKNINTASKLGIVNNQQFSQLLNKLIIIESILDNTLKGIDNDN